MTAAPATAPAALAKRPRGRPRKWDDEIREAARQRYLAGDTPVEIAATINAHERTIRGWIWKLGWHRELMARRQTASGIEDQIAALSRGRPTPKRTDQLAKLTKSLERMRRIAPKAKPRPVVRRAVRADLLEAVRAPDYGLYSYQREFLASEDRFRCVLKSRQIGFSYAIGLGCVLAAAAGRNQLVVSASEDQAQIILDYARHHSERLDLALDDDTGSAITLAGSTIRVLSTNFRTVQGFAGDVWFDEFAWLRAAHQKRLWSALVPSITAMGGRVTVTSTPFLPGTLHWELAENHQGRWAQFARWRITIHDAIAQGMPLPGGLEELRGLFDSESWQMMYLCQYAESGDALLGWQLLHSLTAPDIHRLTAGRLRGGVDVGRTGHRFAVALLGQEQRGEGDFSDRFVLRHHELRKGLPFAAQRQTVLDLDSRHTIEAWRIDRTGLGMQLAEELTALLSPRAVGVHFDQGKKQRMALNLLKLAEDKRLVLPNDPEVLANLHSVQKIATASGLRYDAPSDDSGHGDLFWALAMAADGRAKYPDGAGVKVELWH